VSLHRCHSSIRVARRGSGSCSLHHHRERPSARFVASSIPSASPRRFINVVVARALRGCLYKCQELSPALTYKQQHQPFAARFTPAVLVSPCFE
jgi:hypothetical protein